jgi:PIN domain nuclease of toxin-antitoxin system
MRYVLDTHSLIWRLIQPSKLSPRMRSVFSDTEADFIVPTMAVLEIQYLVEIKRVKVDIDAILESLRETPRFQTASFDEMAMIHAIRLTTTRDPFDRIILAQALSLSTPILTKDLWMRRTAPHLVIF